MLYTFFREGGFYPLEFGSDEVAKANAACNPGTLRVFNEVTRATIWEQAANWLDALPQVIRILEGVKLGSDAAGEEFSSDEISVCLIALRGIQQRKQ